MMSWSIIIAEKDRIVWSSRHASYIPQRFLADTGSRLPRWLTMKLDSEDDLAVLRVMQRCLDAGMQLLREAGFDLEAYGKEQELQHPDGLFFNHSRGRARTNLEYGEHVNGCKIHLVEIGDDDQQLAPDFTLTSPKVMPGSWISGDE